MLVLTRKVQEQIVIGNDGEIRVTILDVKGGQIRLGIHAPRDTVVDREEIWQLKQRQKGNHLGARDAAQVLPVK